MTYAGDRVIYDADSHLMELPDYLTAYADPRIRDRLPPIGESVTSIFDPGDYMESRTHRPQDVEKMLALGDNLTKGPKWHDALGSFDGGERALALDLLGFERQVIFSSFCARLIFGATDPDIAYGAAAAQNRAMADFVSADRRMVGVAMVPLDDPQRALEEINASLDLGLGAVCIGTDPHSTQAKVQ